MMIGKSEKSEQVVTVSCIRTSTWRLPLATSITVHSLSTSYDNAYCQH